MSNGTIQYDEIWQQMSDEFQLTDHLHGPTHWKQVESNGLEITRQSGADEIVVRLFAVLHDSQRWNNGYDPDHGVRAAATAKLIHGQLFEINELQMDLLCEALKLHNDGLTSDDPTIGTCWDADRMDLVRVNISPDPKFMSTEFAKEWASRRQR